MTEGDFTYRTKAKDSDEAIALCQQCHSKPLVSKKLTTSFSNLSITNVEFKDGLWIVTGTFDVVTTERIVAK